MLVASAAILGSLPFTAGFASGAEGDGQDLPPVDSAALEAAVADQQQEAEQRLTPEAHQAREESATAFASQSPSDAVGTAQDEHPEIVEQPAWRSLTPQQADQVEQYYGDFGARVDIPGEPSDGMVESTLPLRAETDSGTKAPVNLSLTDQGDTLEPTRPLVETAIPDEVGDGVALESGIGFAPDASAAGANASAHVVQDTAVYPNVREDSDFLARPTPTGAEALIQLRSEASPESFGLDFALPAGAHLEQGGELGGPQIVQGDEKLGEVTAPLAWDAEGWPVEVSYHLDGDQMVIEVPHRDQDVAYPLLIDPAVIDDQASFASSDHIGWQSAVSPANSPRIQNSYVSGNLRTQGGPGTYTAGEWGGWHFDAPGSESVIYGGAFSNLAVTQSNSAVTQGLWAPSSNAWDQGTTNNSLFPNSPFTKTTNVFTTAQIRHCLGPTFCIGGTGGNQLWTRMSSTSANHSGTFTMLTGGATMWIADFTPPVQDAPEQTTNGQADLPAWIRGDESLSTVVKGQDHGLGVKSFKITATPPSGQPFEGTRTHDCWGTRWYRCPHGDDFSPSNGANVSGDSFTYPAALFPEGTTTLQSKVADYAGNWSQDRTWQVKIDRGDPTVDLSGSLEDAANADETLTQPGYTLSVSAHDTRSGVKSVEIKVDGERADYAEQSCAGGGCAGPPSSLSLNTDDYSDGSHSVQVIATDFADRTEEQILPIEIDRHGDVYHALKVTGDPDVDGELIAEEWGQIGSQFGRHEDAEGVATRDSVNCEVAPSCDQTRVRTDLSQSPDGSVAMDVTTGTSDADTALEPVVDILKPATASASPDAFGSLTSIKKPWQTLPPRHASQYMLYESSDSEEGGEQTSRLWVDADTQMPVQETVSFDPDPTAPAPDDETEPGGEVSETSYWTYEPIVKDVSEFGPDFFHANRPETTVEETKVERFGASPPDQVTDLETGSETTPYDLGEIAIPPDSSGSGDTLCLASVDVVHFKSADDPEMAESQIDDSEADPDLPSASPSASTQTMTDATYGITEPGDTCAPGSTDPASPPVQVMTSDAQSTPSESMTAAYQVPAEAAANNAGDDPEGVLLGEECDGDAVAILNESCRIGTVPVVVDGVSTDAYVVPVADSPTTETALVQIADATVVVQGEFNMAAVADIMEGLEPNE